MVLLTNAYHGDNFKKFLGFLGRHMPGKKSSGHAKIEDLKIHVIDKKQSSTKETTTSPNSGMRVQAAWGLNVTHAADPVRPTATASKLNVGERGSISHINDERKSNPVEALDVKSKKAPFVKGHRRNTKAFLPHIEPFIDGKVLGAKAPEEASEANKLGRSHSASAGHIMYATQDNELQTSNGFQRRSSETDLAGQRVIAAYEKTASATKGGMSEQYFAEAQSNMEIAKNIKIRQNDRIARYNESLELAEKAFALGSESALSFLQKYNASGLETKPKSSKFLVMPNAGKARRFGRSQEFITEMKSKSIEEAKKIVKYAPETTPAMYFVITKKVHPDGFKSEGEATKWIDQYNAMKPEEYSKPWKDISSELWDAMQTTHL